MASEPKPNRPSRKRPQGAGEEWDYYYGGPPMPPRPMGPPMKRPRPDMPPIAMKRTLVPIAGKIPKPMVKPRGKGGQPAKIQPQPALLTYSSPDVLICGNCKAMFTSLEKLTEHKRQRCRLRFTCKCNDVDSKNKSGEPPLYICATCSATFLSCWELCQHCQTEHSLNIYVPPKKQTLNTENSQTSVNDSAGSAANSVTDGNGENSHEEEGDGNGDILNETAESEQDEAQGEETEESNDEVIQDNGDATIGDEEEEEQEEEEDEEVLDSNALLQEDEEQTAPAESNDE